jgi:hypothetical protein
MSNTENQWIMLVAVIFLIAGTFVVSNQRDELKAEAVKRGFAEWVVKSNGSTTWQWKEETK